MEGDLYFIYVLKLENGGFYVGSTKNLKKRLRTHFKNGGAMATKEYKAIEIVEIKKLVDYKMKHGFAHGNLEIGTAIQYSKKYGKHLIRGAKHGNGWQDEPSSNSIKIIARFTKFMSSNDYKTLLKNARQIDLTTFRMNEN
ncbi:hypothetical protein GCM10022393_00500 [Aquimarina addita]|uniref:GIY-YIG domain-containing protein n=1 Tax=Aquimarina addita TaxID=870485 RepID=A0ABP7X7P9_9FLAO